jgi:hypothetical protein
MEGGDSMRAGDCCGVVAAMKRICFETGALFMPFRTFFDRIVSDVANQARHFFSP